MSPSKAPCARAASRNVPPTNPGPLVAVMTARLADQTSMHFLYARPFEAAQRSACRPPTVCEGQPQGSPLMPLGRCILLQLRFESTRAYHLFRQLSVREGVGS